MTIYRQEFAADRPDKQPVSLLAERPVSAAHLATAACEAAMGSEVSVERIRFHPHATNGERIVDRVRILRCMTSHAGEQDYGGVHVSRSACPAVLSHL